MAARVRPGRKMTLEARKARADAYADRVCGPSEPGTAKGKQWLTVWGAYFNGDVAGWRARGRADRVTKAVVEAAKIYCATEREKWAAMAKDGKSHWARLQEAVAKLERAKGRK